MKGHNTHPKLASKGMYSLPSIIDHKLRSDLTGSKNVEGMSKNFAYFRLFFTFLNGVT